VKYKDDIEDITETSKQELKIGKNLINVQKRWDGVEFETVKHKDTTIFTLKLIEEHFEGLEEHQMLINNMQLSKFVGFYEKEVEKWKYDLGSVYDVVQALIEVQK
jgi:dynein heavy chain